MRNTQKGIYVELLRQITASKHRRRVAKAIHSIVMEGLIVSQETPADAQDYLDVHIDSDELVAQTRTRYSIKE